MRNTHQDFETSNAANSIQPRSPTVPGSQDVNTHKSLTAAVLLNTSKYILNKASFKVISSVEVAFFSSVKNVTSSK